MADKVSFTVHGLDADNKLVRADVFARKLREFLKGLRLADKFVNGKRSHEYIIEDLKLGSALVLVREKHRTRAPEIKSSVDTYEAAARAIYDGQPSALTRFPRPLIKTFTSLSEGTEKDFQHAELGFEDENIIRIDDYLLRQSERALIDVHADVKRSNILFRGVAGGTFDGTLRMIDTRGELLRAKLITTAGTKEIDCVVKKDKVRDFSENFERRVRVEGIAHYDGESALPLRVDVKSIRPIKADADLKRWKGAFRGSAALKEDW